MADNFKVNFTRTVQCIVAGTNFITVPNGIRSVRCINTSTTEIIWLRFGIVGDFASSADNVEAQFPLLANSVESFAFPIGATHVYGWAAAGTINAHITLGIGA